eukprot:TRINITY_DN127909_c0_g1_i1.p1 TRINITY_DN127909_c0_g1~~TRINITY_DN127909_c0_g1_i1.p1  ORF type:complete len:220 (-),score=61.89 TRINITY_DN127909_c0_g1_i1:238-897(-)
MDGDVLASEFAKRQLIDSAKNGQSKQVIALLAARISANLVDPRTGRTALHEAVCRGHTDTVRALLRGKAKLETPTMLSRQTPLHLAAAYGKVDIVRLLLQRRHDVDLVDKQGNTPLHLASTGGVCKALLRAGAEPIVANRKGQLPVDIARENRYDDVVTQLQQFHIDELLEIEKSHTKEKQKLVELQEKRENSEAERIKKNFVKKLLKKGLTPIGMTHG